MTFENAKMVAILGALVAVTMGGCIGASNPLPDSILESERPFDGTYTWRPAEALLGDGTVVPQHPWVIDADRPLLYERLVPGTGAEPTLGFTSSKALFTVSGDEIYRSRDHGLTWQLVQTFQSPNVPQTEDMWRSGDPLLWVDTITDRVYASHLFPGTNCMALLWSDDEGDTWTEKPVACGSPYMDHQKMITTPPVNPATSALPGTPATYPNVFYNCYNKIEFGTMCSISHNGGLSYAYESQVSPQSKLCGAINGFPAAWPDGAVGVPLGGFAGGDNCGRGMTVSITENDGLTFEDRVCAPEYGQAEIDPDITVTPDGTAYILFRDTRDQLVYLARTTDKFLTCEVFKISPPDHTMGVFTAITSGDDGRIAMSYLGTRDPQDRYAIPSDARQGSVWHLFVTYSFNAGDADPVFVTQQSTPEEDPVQLGCVWLSGGGGGTYGCRNLLDFIDMHHDVDGRVAVAFTDGCTPRRGCTGSPDTASFQSTDRQVAVSVQDSGYSLFAAKGVLPSLGLTPPAPAPPVEK